MNRHRVLVLNPGSTSTKLALFADEDKAESTNLRHSASELAEYKSVWGQFEFRLGLCRDWVRFRVPASAVVGIGGLLRPMAGGTYTVSPKMVDDARKNLQGEHASNLGCALAYELGREFGCPSYVVDPVSVDELEPIARYSGHPLISRRSLSHALSIHTAARHASEELDIPFSNSAFVVAHLGGGISVAPVLGGKIIDVNDASSDGPFSPERSGGLPLQQVISLCFSGKYIEGEIRSMVMGRGGLVAYLGTNSVEDVGKRIGNGDGFAREVFEAMAYQVAKEVGAMATVLRGGLNAVLLTGGLTASHLLVAMITERVQFLAPVLVYPEEEEMKALALGVLRVLNGTEQAKEY
ncbi:MAG: butyrate kinase [Bacteroidota bacterium]